MLCGVYRIRLPPANPGSRASIFPGRTEIMGKLEHYALESAAWLGVLLFGYVLYVTL